MICAANGLPCFKDLIAVLFECFSIISLGYLSCRFKLVSSQAKDLNSYLTNLALPMIIFLNIAQMEFRTINLSFLLCVLVAKLVVFSMVTLLTLTISYPTNFGYAGSLSILATQSNDFALGYPLIKLLYGESKPEMLNYLSLMAPIQLLILNPLGIAMLEFQKSKNHRKRTHHHHGGTKNSDNSDSNSPERSADRSRCRASERSNQQIAQATVELSNSYSHESTKSVSPTRLIQVADPLQTGPVSHRTRSSSRAQAPQLIDSSMTVPKTDVLVSRSRKTSNEDEMRRLKFRHKNVRSLMLALPARQPLSQQQLTSRSEGELDRPISVELTLDTSQRTPSAQNKSDRYADGFDDEMSSGCVGQLSPNTADKRGHQGISVGADVGPTHRSSLDLSFFKALATNPLILASIVALLVNLIHGPELPKYITRVSNTIAASFAAPALFVVGLSMYGKFELLLRNPRDLILSSVMVLTKGLLLPSLVRTIALLVLPSFTPAEDVPYLVDFAFLYGLLPTAPTACIIAKQYGVLQNVVSISMLLSTIIAGPLTLASSVIISPTSMISTGDIENVIAQTMEISAVLTLLLAPFTLYTFLRTKNSRLTYRNLLRASRGAASNSIKRLLRANPIRVFVLLLALSQIMIGIGGLLWLFIDTTELNDSSQLHPALLLNPRPEAAGAHNIIDPLDEHQNDSTATAATTPTFEPQIVGRLHTSTTLSPRRSWLADHHLELGDKTLSSLRYILSAGGLMMAQFCILSLVLVIAATKLCDRATARHVSEILLKACFSVLVCLVVWLAYDSEQLVHLPVEASLPSSAQSLCVRLIYNVAILTISLPLYAHLIRTDNRIREALKRRVITDVNDTGARASSDAELEVNGFAERRFVTSSASLDSDASSAATSNTNLDFTPSSGPCVVHVSLSGSINQSHTVSSSADSLSIILDSKLQESTQRSISPVLAHVVNPDAHIFGPAYVSSLISSPCSNGANKRQQQQPQEQPIGGQADVIVDSNNNNNPTDLEGTCDNEQQHHHHCSDLSENEFNKYSVLIVFMLINSTLNLFSVAQKLLHEEPVGTFRQIEIIGIAFEFGQGLLTFLIYGTGTKNSPLE